MHDDVVSAAAESQHSFSENVPSRCLYDVYHEFGTIGFKLCSLFLHTDAMVGAAFAVKLISADAGLYIYKVSA